MAQRQRVFRAALLGAAAFSIAACDNEILLWPWVEPSNAPRPAPPAPPTEPVDPLIPIDEEVTEPAPDAPGEPEPPVEGAPPEPSADGTNGEGQDEDEGSSEDAEAPEDAETPTGDVGDAAPDAPDADGAQSGEDAADETPPSEPSTPVQPETPGEPEPPVETITPAFFYHAPGDLEPGSGEGARDDTVYVPDMVFPIKDAPSYLQSQVYRFGGSQVGGDQCDPRNFEAPWRDNYCEIRSRDNGTPYCPTNRVHLGQDIRVGTPEGCRAERSLSPSQRVRYAAVATEDGVISNIGRYTVNLRAGGRIYRYMHLNMQALEVELGDNITAGQTLGYVSNDFGGTPTTFHLHFEIKHNTAEHGWTWAPPYMSLVRAYERREGAPGVLITGEAPVLVASD